MRSVISYSAPKSFLSAVQSPATPKTDAVRQGASAFGSSRRSSQVAALQVDVLYEKTLLFAGPLLREILG